MAGPAFVVVCAARRGPPDTGCPTRLGITVSRKVGNAVVRNRVKRKIREWFRAGRAPLGAGVDLVVIGRAAAAGLAQEGVANELARLATAATEIARRAGAA